MQPKSVFVGIDVACAKRKRLPICFVEAGNRLMPLELPLELENQIPRGPGNIEIKQREPFSGLAQTFVTALLNIETTMGWSIKRIAIDAPASPPISGSRKSEDDLDLSSIRTPDQYLWPKLKENCIRHFEEGGQLNRLPDANRIWMLYGFQLFKHLRKNFKCEVIEVYPAAIVRTIAPGCKHKSSSEGLKEQLEKVAQHTGWNADELKECLNRDKGLPMHDRLDAYMAAWVASLSQDRRRAYGDKKNLDDSIWVPIPQ